MNQNITSVYFRRFVQIVFLETKHIINRHANEMLNLEIHIIYFIKIELGEIFIK